MVYFYGSMLTPDRTPTGVDPDFGKGQKAAARYRLDANGSGFDHLLLAGDWVFTGQGGAAESAVIGDMQAAEALSGEPLDLVGARPNPWSRLPTSEAPS